jgi:hypothetical protein
MQLSQSVTTRLTVVKVSHYVKKTYVQYLATAYSHETALDLPANYSWRQLLTLMNLLWTTQNNYSGDST